MKKALKYIVAIILLIPLCIYLPKFVALYAICGLYDVLRNRKLDRAGVERYFFGNGMLTWLLSPLNVLMDIFALPYVNKGIYRLEDLPQPWQEEVERMIQAAYSENLVARLEERAKENARSMIFFKWYGENVETFLDAPSFHEPYKYIQTIGVSVFNKKQSTSKHYGPFRATIRVLFNINDVTTDQAYIEVGDVKHYWKDEKLFIFDDTLQHQSFNETDQPRYNMFVDIVRPSGIPEIFVLVVKLNCLLLKGTKAVFYKNWKVLGK